MPTARQTSASWQPPAPWRGEVAARVQRALPRPIRVHRPRQRQSRTRTAQQVAQALHGIAKGIKVVELPDVPEKGDLSDWLDQGHTKAELAELVKAAPEWKPSPGDKQPKPATEPKKPEPPPYVPFPTDALPKVVADFIHEGAAALGCDESYIALPLLAACRGCRGQHPANSTQARLERAVHPLDDHRGRSGTLKSPALDLALARSARYRTRRSESTREAMEQYRTDKATFDADLVEWKKKRRKERRTSARGARGAGGGPLRRQRYDRGGAGRAVGRATPGLAGSA